MSGKVKESKIRRRVAQSQNARAKRFLEKAKEKFKDKFSYSKVNYVNARIEVIIVCKVHGDFKQTPDGHLRSKFGCEKCARFQMATYKSNEEWIIKAREIHEDVYDYSLVTYINGAVPIIIICWKHGEFTQTPNIHLNGHGCDQCAIKYRTQYVYNTQDFINKATEIHGDRFDYSLVNYVDSDTEVTIICPELGHGEFKQKPSLHFRSKYGCRDCNNLHKNKEIDPTTGEDFVRRAIERHGGKYGYPEMKYVDYKTPVNAECKSHGTFEIIPTFHLRGDGCSGCADINEYSAFEFVYKATELHGEIYDYSAIDYVDMKTNITVKCKSHGPFQISPVDHLAGARCGECAAFELRS